MLNVVPAKQTRLANAELFAYSGAVTASVIAATGESLRARLAALNVGGQQARKIFSSFVELGYNVIHHGEPEGVRDVKIVRCGSIVVWQVEGNYHLLSRSLVAKAKAPLLAERLNTLRGLSGEQIRFEFRLRLTNLQFASDSDTSVGAGLGLLTIARNAAQPIEYALEPTPADAGMLELQIHTVIQ